MVPDRGQDVSAVSLVLRAAISDLGLDPLEFSPHSLRIGRATDLAWVRGAGSPDQQDR